LLGINYLEAAEHEPCGWRSPRLGANLASSPSVAFDCARHSTRTMICDQLSPMMSDGPHLGALPPSMRVSGGDAPHAIKRLKYRTIVLI